VEREVAGVRDGVGVFDASSFAKYEISGPGAAAALDHMAANALPALGRVRLAPLLAESGRLMGDLTAMRLAEDRFMLFGSGYLQAWHGRWFQHRLSDKGIAVRNCTDDLQGLILAGPSSRELLSRLTDLDTSSAALPPLAVRSASVAGADAIVARLSLSGELSFEIYVQREQLVTLYEQIHAAGQDLGLVDFGLHALNSMRLEKSVGVWSREYSRDTTPGASGLDRFVDFAKPDFIGRAAALAEREAGSSRTLATFVVDAKDADASGYEPILRDGQMVGYVTSGGYGHRTSQSIALGYIDRAAARHTEGFVIPILGDPRPARLVPEPLYDPQGLRTKA
jgi:dimethylglycine dehydrogenase